MRLLALLALLPVTLCAEGVQGWYQNSVWLRLNEKWSVGNFVDLRADDGIGRLHAWMVSPRVRYDLNANWQLQANVSYFDGFNPDETSRPNWLRFEFEANPNFRLSDEVVLSFRNRFEWRWRDEGADYNTRLRIRPQIDWTLHREGLFRGLYANNEIMYEFATDRFSENRLIPLGVVLRPSEHLDLRLFYLWRTARGAREWRNYHGIGVLAGLNY
jgi:hypothetical protein